MSRVTPIASVVARCLLPSAVRARMRHWAGQTPVNYRKRDAAPAAIAADVDYAIEIGDAYLGCLAAEGIDPAGKTVLELGPGVNFGSILLLACRGARPVVADRFLAEWEPNYHPLFYAALRDRLTARHPEFDCGPVDRLLARGCYMPGEILRIRGGAEELLGLATGSVDIALSNAVLEHVGDLPAASRELARVAKPGGWGFHQIDFRYHPDFSRPLEHLLLGEAEFRRLVAHTHGECGTQWRPCEAARQFEAAGFAVGRFVASMTADPAYLDEFEPRLRRSRSRYRELPRAELAVLSGLFCLRRREGLAAWP